MASSPRRVRLADADGMALAHANQLDSPVEPAKERLDERRLAKAGLATDQDQLTATRLRRQRAPQRCKRSVSPRRKPAVTVSAGSGRGTRCADVGDEPVVTVAVHGADHILALTVVTGNSPRRLDAAGNCRIGDETVMPDPVHQLLFGCQATPMPCEVGQNLQPLRFYVLRCSCALQLEAVQIHRYIAYLVHPARRVRCVRRRPFHPHILSTSAPRPNTAMFLMCS